MWLDPGTVFMTVGPGSDFLCRSDPDPIDFLEVQTRTRSLGN